MVRLECRNLIKEQHCTIKVYIKDKCLYYDIYSVIVNIAGASTPDISKQKYNQPQFGKSSIVVNDNNGGSEYDSIYDEQR